MSYFPDRIAAVLCPECFAKTKGEEKCCSHGTEVGAKCVECGAVRAKGEPYWPCVGTRLVYR